MRESDEQVDTDPGPMVNQKKPLCKWNHIQYSEKEKNTQPSSLSTWRHETALEEHQNC